ncbi:MAG: hypothetical protein IKS78_01050, partial [Clostridia bacterium]|nr:hypothetical protein [Clostridia bacterium]
MIKKLRLRFIRLSLIALTLAMFIVVGVVDLAMWLNVKSELNQTLEYISENNTVSPREWPDSGSSGGSRRIRVMAGESSWAKASFDKEGNIRSISTAQLASNDEEGAREAALKAYASGSKRGFQGKYLFLIRSSREGGNSVTLLDCENRLRSFNNLLLISLIACVGGILLAFVILL